MTLPPLPSPHESSAPLPEPARDEPPTGEGSPGARARVAPRPAPGGAVRAGVRCGIFAAAATAGVMVGFARHGAAGALAPFAATGRMLLGVAAGDGRGAQLLALGAGAALHVALVVGWAVLFSLLAGALRGARLWLAAALFTAGVYWASELLLPPMLRLGHGTRAFPPQVAVLYATLALALAVGMRLALSTVARRPRIAATP